MNTDLEHTDAQRRKALRKMLAPRSVAVVGASRSADKVGGAILRNLLAGDFQGPVFPVNPNAESVAGVMAYGSLSELPMPVDLVVVAAPPEAVPRIVDDSAAIGATGLCVVTAGYGEAGESGRQREAQLREQVRKLGLLMIGPNALGVLNMAPTVRLNATFAAAVPPIGGVAMASQSGALGIALLDQARGIGLGVSQFVSLGNRVDVSSNDLLELWEGDDATKVILLYLESFGSAQNFKPIARRVSRRKPIIAVKGGRSAAGARAASSHTGALAGASVGAEALFRQAGVLQVESIEAMLGVAQVLHDQPTPRGDRVAIVTNAGGPGILAADACAANDLQVADLARSTKQALRSFLPSQASVENPVDMIASATPEAFGRAVETVLGDEGVDALILIYIEPLVTRPEPVAEAVRAAVRASDRDIPVVACFMMARGAPEALHLGEGRQVPSFVFPEDAVRALAYARRYQIYRERSEGTVPSFGDLRSSEARSTVKHALDSATDVEGWLMPEEAAGLLADFGIPVVPTVVAQDADEAIAFAEKLGWPVVLKLRSRTLVHKTEVDGVQLGLENAEAVRAAWTKIVAGVTKAGEEDAMEGVVVQPMVDFRNGHEVIVGMTRDRVFGPLIMVGLGGIHVELLKDVAFAMHPLTDVDPRRMLERLRGMPLLEGWRGAVPADLPALEELLLRFSSLVGELPELEQIELNPVLVRPRGQGCVALDMRAGLLREQSRTTLASTAR